MFIKMSDQMIHATILTAFGLVVLTVIVSLIIGVKKGDIKREKLKAKSLNMVEGRAYYIIKNSSPSLKPEDCVKLVEIFTLYGDVFYTYYKLNSVSITDTFVEDVSNFLHNKKLGVDHRWAAEVIQKYCFVLNAEKEKIEFFCKYLL